MVRWRLALTTAGVVPTAAAPLVRSPVSVKPAADRELALADVPAAAVGGLYQALVTEAHGDPAPGCDPGHLLPEARVIWITKNGDGVISWGCRGEKTRAAAVSALLPAGGRRGAGGVEHDLEQRQVDGQQRL